MFGDTLKLPCSNSSKSDRFFGANSSKTLMHTNIGFSDVTTLFRISAIYYPISHAIELVGWHALVTLLWCKRRQPQ